MGTPGLGTRDSKTLGLGDVGPTGLEDVINEQHLIFSLNLLITIFSALEKGINYAGEFVSRLVADDFQRPWFGLIHFTCKSENVVYCISCRRCPQLYIGETGRALHERFGEHLRSIQKNTGGFPVAEHFNSPGHSLSDIAVRGLRRCPGSSFRRKQLEMEIIFRLGTMQPDGLNNVFHFI